MSDPEASDTISTKSLEAHDATASLMAHDVQRARDATGQLPPIVPGYQLHRLLGSGTTGQVWGAIQEQTQQKVAVKILQPEVLDVDYLQQEVLRLGRVSEHPHVVTLLTANLTGHPPHLVMPLLSGSLEPYVQEQAWEQGKVDVEKAVRWFRQMASALQYMHHKGILHCDFKPANVLVDDEGDVRVVDFGQSHMKGQQGGVSLGTFWYMPPEQSLVPPDALEFPVPDVSWDVYALGATMYHLLTGRKPRATVEARDQLTHCTHVLEQVNVYRSLLRKLPLAPVRQLNPQVDVDLACIVEHCLELDAEKRYPSVEEVLADLYRRHKRLPLQAHPATMEYVLRRFLARNLVPVLAFALILCVQVAQVAFNLRNAHLSAMESLESRINHSYLAFRQSEAERFRWLDLLAESQSTDPALHKVILATSFQTWYDSLAEVRDHFDEDPQHGDLLLLLTDAGGNTLVRTDNPSPPQENVSALGPVRAALKGDGTPGHGYMRVGDRLYCASAVPWFKGNYVDGALLVGWRVSGRSVARLSESTDSQLTFMENQQLMASSLQAPDTAQLVAGAERFRRAQVPKTVEQVDLHGETYLALYADLEPGSPGRIVIQHVAVDPLLQPLRRLESSYVLQSVVAVLLGAAVIGYLLWRSEAVSSSAGARRALPGKPAASAASKGPGA